MHNGFYIGAFRNWKCAFTNAHAHLQMYFAHLCDTTNPGVFVFIKPHCLFLRELGWRTPPLCGRPFSTFRAPSARRSFYRNFKLEGRALLSPRRPSTHPPQPRQSAQSHATTILMGMPLPAQPWWISGLVWRAKIRAPTFGYFD